MLKINLAAPITASWLPTLEVALPSLSAYLATQRIRRMIKKPKPLEQSGQQLNLYAARLHLRKNDFFLEKIISPSTLTAASRQTLQRIAAQAFANFESIDHHFELGRISFDAAQALSPLSHCIEQSARLHLPASRELSSALNEAQMLIHQKADELPEGVNSFWLVAEAPNFSGIEMAWLSGSQAYMAYLAEENASLSALLSRPPKQLEIETALETITLELAPRRAWQFWQKPATFAEIFTHA